MKKSLYFLFVACLATSCRHQKEGKNIFHSYSIETAVTDTLYGKIICTGKAGETYDEIDFCDPFLILCRHHSDTSLHVFRYANKIIQSAFIINQTTLQMPSPHLCQHNSMANKHEITIWDNTLHQWTTLNLQQGKLTTPFTFLPRYYSYPHPIYLPDCNNLFIFEHSIYATDISGTGSPLSLFYRYDYAKEECSFIPPYAPMVGNTPRNQSLFYTQLAIHEKKNSIVAAPRFFNSLSFFNLDGTPCKVITYGENFQRPVTDTIRGFVDRINSPKYFLAIQSTEQYVYCLYDGTPSMKAPSRILVFEWDGTHVASWQTDRNLYTFAVDPTNSYLLALAPNEKEGQDILLYPLRFQNKRNQKQINE